MEEKKTFWRAFLQIWLFSIIPVIWDKYVHIRRDLESFLLYKKNEMERTTFEEIIQLLPDSVVIVGK